MQIPCQNDALIAQGIQFRVLAHAFPVLRHDAIKPISNAKLATAMMQKTGGEEYADERTQQLLIDLDFMLDEGVDTVRLLAEWLSDSGKTLDVIALLGDCSKLLFTHLLLSGKKLRLAETGVALEVAQYSGRYVLLAWLLHMVETMPDGAELVIEYVDGERLCANVIAGGGSTPLRASDLSAQPVMPLAAASQLALFHGWALAQDGANGWIMSLPDQARSQDMAA